MMRVFTIFLFPVILFFSGCSQEFSSLLPADVRRIHISSFVNKTFYLNNGNRVFTKDLDVFLTDHLLRSFLKDGRLQVVDEEDAQWDLQGEILRYSLTPCSYSRTDFTRIREFRAVMLVSLTLIDKESKKTLWLDKKFQCRENFFVEGDHMSSERSVLHQICQRMAHNILITLFEGWYR